MVLAIVAVVVVGAGVALLVRSNRDPERPGPRYCIALSSPAKAVEKVEGAVTGKPVIEGLDLRGVGALAAMDWTDATVEAAPASERDRVRVVVDGLNAALAAGSVGPLEDPGFTAAVEHLEARSDELCPS